MYFRALYLAFAFVMITIPVVSQELYLVAQDEDETFLGCLNCGEYHQNSIWNKLGLYGSKYGIHSIWNKYSLYGGDIALLSPFNKYSISPPRIVDREGSFYGYFTVNQYLPQRADLPLLETMRKYIKIILDNPEQFIEWYNNL